jgi:hypothetical protein
VLEALPSCSGAKLWSLTASVGISGGVGRPWRHDWLTADMVATQISDYFRNVLRPFHISSLPPGKCS